MKLNKKILATLVTALSASAFVGVGFASWTIVQDAPGSSSGGISADATVSASVFTLGSPDVANGAIKFGPRVATAGNEWLTASLEKQENIHATVTFEFTYTTSVASAPMVFKNLGFALDTDPETDEYDAAVTAGYIGALPTVRSTAATSGTYLVPTAVTTGAGAPTANTYYPAGFYTISFTNLSSGTTVSETTAGTPGTYTVAGTLSNNVVKHSGKIVFDIYFAWGSHFNHLNPIDFYNQYHATDVKTGTTTYAMDATSSITALKALNDANRQYTLSFTLATAA